jgi:hypothetical protein
MSPDRRWRRMQRPLASFAPYHPWLQILGKILLPRWMIHNCKKTGFGSKRRNWTRTCLVFLPVHLEPEEAMEAAEATLYTGRSDIRRRNRGRRFHNSHIYYNISYLRTKRRPLPPRIVAKQLEQQRPKLLVQLRERPSSSLKFLWKRLNSRYYKGDKASWLGNSDQRDEAQQQLYFSQETNLKKSIAAQAVFHHRLLPSLYIFSDRIFCSL